MAQDRRAVILDFVQGQIEAFDVDHGGGIVVRKDSRGYTLIREIDEMPVARLRPGGEGLFEVYCWSPDRDRWRPVGEFGTTLSLDDALEFIADDPMDCFWR
jgi:hypothetical protein